MRISLKPRYTIALCGLMGATWMTPARADGLAYHLAVDKPLYYEVKLVDTLPDHTRTTTNYLKLRTAAVDGTGQATIRYDWGTTVTADTQSGQTRSSTSTPPAFLSGPQPGDDSPGLELVIAPDGTIARVIGDMVPTQFPHLAGAIYLAALLPLPPSPEKTTWMTQQDSTYYTESSHKEAGGVWGSHDVTVRENHKCHESITYTLGERKGALQTIQRTYSLVSDEKIGDKPIDQLTGTGQYDFDTESGAVQSSEINYTNEITTPTVSVKIPLKISTRRLGGDELAALKAQSDALIAKRTQEEAARVKAEAIGAHDTDQLPAGTSKTPMVGGTGGGPFMQVNENNLPLIGLRVRMGGWGGKKVVGHITPLYEKPTDKPGRDETDFIARDNYLLGGLWVNGTDVNACAIRVIFMKKTDKGVDPKSAYMTAWFGQLDGPSRVKVGCTGHVAIGIFGRQGLNTAAIGLVMLDGDTAPGGGAADPTDDPNFKGTPAPAQ